MLPFLFLLVLFVATHTKANRPNKTSCRYKEYNLEPFRNVTLTAKGNTGGKFEVSLCGNLPQFCVDSLTHNKIPGQVFTYFGDSNNNFHCWDVLVLPDVVPASQKTPDGLQLVYSRRGDAHLSCDVVQVVATISCQRNASSLPSKATMTGYQKGCSWYFNIQSSHPNICTPKLTTTDDDPSRVTTTTNGPLQGVVSTSGNTRSFLGIPYAQPPVDDLRWQPPRALVPHATTTAASSTPYDATKFASSCWQQGGSFGHEDCLYLNVYAPVDKPSASSSSSSYPILFWIHGGCYVSGTPNADLGNGTALVEQFQDVIIVSVTYRLHAFGFLGTNALRHHRHKESTGNWGIQDQRMGMRWVQENIAAFGGDPKRVMIFGQSAGAGSVATHLVTRKSWGLFSRAVMESGSYTDWIAMDLQGSEKNWKALVTKCGCDKEAIVDEETKKKKTVACMRQVPAQRLATLAGTLNVPCRDGCTFAPVVDGVEMKEYPWHLIAKKHGRAPNVPIMHGSNLDDGLLFVNMSRSGTDKDLNVWIRKMYGEKNVKPMKALYPLNEYPWEVSSPLTKHFWVADQIETDFAYFCGAHRTSYAFTNGGGYPRVGSENASGTSKQHGDGVPVFQYRFAQKAHQDTTVLHGDELPFVWLEVKHESVKEQPVVAQVISTLWTNFARTGNPNHGVALPLGTPVFPQWSTKKGGDQVYQLQEKIEIVNGVDRARCQLIDREFLETFGERCLPCTVEDVNCN